MTAPTENIAQECIYCGSSCRFGSGKCHCGCGESTPLSKENNGPNIKRGYPRKYMSMAHALRKPRTDICICGNPNCGIPFGLCHCGCERTTPIAKVSNKDQVIGLPKKYCQGHRVTYPKTIPKGMCICGKMNCPIPYGTCHCGCGEATKVITDSRYSSPKRGQYLNSPLAYVNGHDTRLSPIEYTVEDRGYKTPCWIWQRSKNKKGYGCTRRTGAHIYYYEQKNGKVPDEMELDHLCRQRACVNPDHLEPVTDAVNSQRGICAKLSPEVVKSIRARVRNGEVQVEISRELEVSASCIWSIVHRKTWRNI